MRGETSSSRRFIRVFERSSLISGIAAIMLASFLSPGAGAQTASAPVRILQQINVNRRVTLRGNTPILARREYDRGPAPDDLLLSRMLLVLKRSPEQEDALRKLLISQQVKSATNYHQWLTPEEFGNRFGAADADIQTIVDWLAGQGFQIDRIAAGRSAIEFSGTAGLVHDAFRTEIHKFEINGKAYWSNAQDPQIPAALAPVVEGLASLNNFPVERLSRQQTLPVHIQRSAGPIPLYTYTGSNGQTYHLLSPADFATIYNIKPLWTAGIDGAGETIAIVAGSNIRVTDVSNFEELFGLETKFPNVIVNGPDPGTIPGPEGEAALDVEWSGAVATNATIDLVVSQDTAATPGFALSALYVVDNNIAPVMSVSYGFCEPALGVAGNAFFNALWEQASAQGISVIVAAGDRGSSTCGISEDQTAPSHGLAVSGIASTPFDVAVGGTDFNDWSATTEYWSSANDPSGQGSALSYIPEITWNDSCAQTDVGTSCISPITNQAYGMFAGGGGPSTCGILTGADPSAACSKGYPKPAWQTGPGVPDDGVRDLPDVSLFAGTGRSNDFYPFCYADANPSGNSECNLTQSGWVEAAGGTSTSAQVFAGIMALVDQKTGQRQGDPNFVLYKLAAQPGASCASNAAAVHNASCVFYDVVTGNNSLPCTANSPNCEPAGTNGAYILVTPTDKTIPAWTAGPGYDLATGLGSVNAANLVNKWNSVSFAPSQTQLTVSPTTLTHGQSAAVTINVSAASGSPTGIVSLAGGPNGTDPGLGRFTLSDGSAMGDISSLPGGTYTVTAHYAGDGNFGASDSKPVSVTVGKENSQTKLSILSFDSGGNLNSTNPSILAYGAPYILHVNVLNAAGDLCTGSQVPSSGCPSGYLALYDNGGIMSADAFSLNNLGQMDDNLIQLSPGTHNLVASYQGDSSYNPSQSISVPLTITKAATTTSIGASNSNVQWGGKFTISASVTTQSNGAYPGNFVEFFSGSSTTPISGVSYSQVRNPTSGAALLNTSLTLVASATATFTADFEGDSNYLASTSGPETVTVTPGFLLAISPSKISISAPGESGSTSISVTSGGGFNGAVALACQMPVSLKGATCSFSPPSVTTAGQSKLTITTAAPQAVSGLFGSSGWFWGGGAMLCLLLFGGMVRRLRFRWALAAALFVLLIVAMAGCGGGNNISAPAPALPDPGTAVGTYNLTITATSGTLSQTATIPVVIE